MGGEMKKDQFLTSMASPDEINTILRGGIRDLLYTLHLTSDNGGGEWWSPRLVSGLTQAGSCQLCPLLRGFSGAS